MLSGGFDKDDKTLERRAERFKESPSFKAAKEAKDAAAARRLEFSSQTTYDTAVVGVCEEMCPSAEELDRIAIGNVHACEKDAAGNPTRLVKAYERTTNTVVLLEEVRTIDTLQRTVAHLVGLLDGRSDADTDTSNARPAYYTTQAFVSDRLRAVVKDIVLQDLDPVTTLPTLRTVVRFHLVNGLVCEDTAPLELYDSKLRRAEFVSALSVLRDRCTASLRSSGSVMASTESDRVAELSVDEFAREAWALTYITATCSDGGGGLSCVELLDEAQGYGWLEGRLEALNSEDQPPTNDVVGVAVRLGLHLRSGNWVRVFRVLQTCPFALGCAALVAAADARAHGVAALTRAYNKTEVLPVGELTRLLCCEGDTQTASLLECYGAEVTAIAGAAGPSSGAVATTTTASEVVAAPTSALGVRFTAKSAVAVAGRQPPFVKAPLSTVLLALVESDGVGVRDDVVGGDSLLSRCEAAEKGVSVVVDAVLDGLLGGRCTSA